MVFFLIGAVINSQLSFESSRFGKKSMLQLMFIWTLILEFLLFFISLNILDSAPSEKPRQ